MKGKFSLMWRVVIALALVLSLGMIMAAPAAADVSPPAVTVSVPAPATASNYTIVFTTNTALTTAAGDTITIEFPTGTTADTIITNVVAADVDVNETTAASVVKVGTRLSITPDADVAAGEVTVAITNTHITNLNPEGIAYTLKVYTSQEPVAVTSATYIIDTIISACTVTLGDADVDTVSAYTITPTLAVAVVENDTITITFPATTTVPTSIGAVDDVTVDGQDLDAVGDYSVSGQTVTLSVPSGVSTGDLQCVTVFTADALIKNPTSIASDWTVTIYTSKDRAVFTSSTYSTAAAVQSHITKIVWKTVDAYIPNDTASSAFVIETQDVYGNAATVGGTITFLLNGDGGVFYEDAPCTTTPIGTINLTNGESESAAFYYKNATAGTKTVTADEVVTQGWTMASTDVIVNPKLQLWGGGELKASYATFALAIDAALPYDTIKVLASTYEETIEVPASQINLTIESVSGAATTIIYNADANMVDLKGESITLDGFTINGDGATTSQRGVYVRKSGVNIKNNIFTNILNDNICVFGEIDAITSGTIDSNTLTGSGADFEDNRAGIVVETYASSISGITITGNTLTGYGAPTTASAGSGAIKVAETDGNGVTSAITVTSNTMTNSYRGLTLYVASNKTLVTIDISSNTITNNYSGVVLESGDTVTATFDLSENTITGNAAYGIDIQTATTLSGTQDIKYNDISGNGDGINIETGTATVVAKYNYWGSPTGPEITANPSGTGDSITVGTATIGEDITYSPWLSIGQATVITSGKSQYATSVTMSNVATLSGATYSGGWNTFSTPIWLDSSVDTWGEATALVTLDYVTAYGWDGTTWTSVSADTGLTPLDAIFVQLKTEAQSIPILYGTQLLVAPTKSMYATAGSYTGWELVGQANLSAQERDVTLASISGSYSQVIDPISGAVIASDGSMVVGAGYWVFMTADGVLAGFSVTPQPFVAVP